MYEVGRFRIRMNAFAVCFDPSDAPPLAK